MNQTEELLTTLGLWESARKLLGIERDARGNRYDPDEQMNDEELERWKAFEEFLWQFIQYLITERKVLRARRFVPFDRDGFEEELEFFV